MLLMLVLFFGTAAIGQTGCELVDPDDNAIEIRGFGDGVVNAQ